MVETGLIYTLVPKLRLVPWIRPGSQAPLGKPYPQSSALPHSPDDDDVRCGSEAELRRPALPNGSLGTRFADPAFQSTLGV